MATKETESLEMRCVESLLVVCLLSLLAVHDRCPTTLVNLNADRPASPPLQLIRASSSGWLSPHQLQRPSHCPPAPCPTSTIPMLPAVPAIADVSSALLRSLL